MSILQCVDAPGDDVVLLEHLLHCLGLLARKLSVDIGDQQFVAEFGHDGLSPLAERARSIAGASWTVGRAALSGRRGSR